jgi:hypothetical protein
MSLTLLAASLALVVDGSFDVRAVAKNPTVQSEVRRLIASGPPQMRTFFSELGFEPLRDLKRVQVLLRESLDQGKGAPLVVLHGRFSPQRIHSSWAKNKSKTAIRAIQFHGKPAYAGSPYNPMFVVDSKSKIIIGPESDVAAMVQGKTQILKKVPPFLRNAPLWVRATFGAEARKALRRRSPQAPQADVEELQLRAQIKGKWVHAKARVRTVTSVAASGLKIMMAMGLANSRQPSLMRLGKALKMRVQGKTLMIDFKMRLDDLMGLRLSPQGKPSRRQGKPSRGQGKPSRSR